MGMYNVDKEGDPVFINLISQTNYEKVLKMSSIESVE